MTASQLDLQPRQFDHFEALENAVLPGWRLHLTRLASGSERGELRQLSTSGMALLRVRWQPKTHIRLTVPAGRTLVVAPLSRRTSVRVDGRSLEEDQLPLMHERHTHDLHCGSDNQLLLVMFDRNAFLNRLNEVWQYLPASWEQRQRLVFHSPGCLAQAIRSIESLMEVMKLRPEYREPPDCQIFEYELSDVFARGSAAEALQTIAARHLKAKAAAAYLSRHLTESISIANLYSRLNTSERLLRRGFTERFGLPPSAFLRVLRLQQIHQTLRASTADEMSVTQIASRCGITHLGRFSADYLRFYGEYPSTTLRRGGYRTARVSRSNDQALARTA